jgi:murein DD-endopeptidase MepM/ murein hydrolase activator NlpD
VLYTPYINTPAGALLRDPTEGACLSSGFGWRGTDTGGGRQHNGIDLANPNGGFVYAAGDGRVIAAEYRGGFGNTVVIDYGHGVQSLYGHLSEIDPNLSAGDRVYSGQAVGRMGMTGNATGVHLHYELTVDGLLVDPLNYGRPPTYVSAPAAQPIPIPDQTFDAAKQPDDITASPLPDAAAAAPTIAPIDKPN